MLEQIKLNLYFFHKVSWVSILIFWSIYLGSVAFMAVLALSFQNSDITFMGVNAMPSLIFTFIFGLLFLKDSFPHVIKLGVNRNSYVISLFIFILLFTAVMVTVSQLSLFVINKVIELLSIDNFNFSGMEIAGLDHIGKMDLILFEAFLYLFAFGFSLLLGCIFFRFGLGLGFAFLAIIPLSLTIQPIMTRLFDLLKYLAIGHEKYNEFAFFIPYAIIAFFIWLIIKNASIVDKTAK